MRTIPCNNWSALASRSPESEFETGYVPHNGILNYSLVRKREELGKCPVWERGGDTRVRQRQRERGGSNGLQDKPTFLKTPRVVITGAKQLNLHTVANRASLSSLCKTKKKTLLQATSVIRVSPE